MSGHVSSGRTAQRWIFWCSVAAAVLLLCFIYGNSLQNGEESRQSSDAVVEVVKPIVDPRDEIEDETFSTIIRKLAHFTEFFLAGYGDLRRDVERTRLSAPGVGAGE